MVEGGGRVSDWRQDIENALVVFRQVAGLAGDPVGERDLEVEYLPAPHRAPTRLPDGKMAIYGFWSAGQWLKVGMVGPNSNARYTSQHYHAGSAPSTLAASLLRDLAMALAPGFQRPDPGAWIKAVTHRVNILMPTSRDKELLPLLEAFLHLRLKPRYEG
ncbi:MAG: hypothetical protein EXR51_08555 [Dehalococcoidia bacterium]|nr:hypothetical protein [Dehalococcoidia bacterium]